MPDDPRIIGLLDPEPTDGGQDSDIARAFQWLFDQFGLTGLADPDGMAYTLAKRDAKLRVAAARKGIEWAIRVAQDNIDSPVAYVSIANALAAHDAEAIAAARRRPT